MLLVIILIVLLLILVGIGKKEFMEYFEKNRLPNGQKISTTKWTEIALISSFVIAVVAGITTRSAAETIGWSIITLFLVSYGGPYVEFAVAWWREKDNNLL